jgi:hypothetical protein
LLQNDHFDKEGGTVLFFMDGQECKENDGTKLRKKSEVKKIKCYSDAG